MAVDKLVPRYLNKDEDPRIVKSIELIDALNIRVSNDDTGNSGVVKNVKGNTLVAYKNTSDALPTGDNKVIGSVTNLEKDEVFYFVFNSNTNHSIYKYSVASEKVVKIYQDPVLRFTQNGFVKADVIVNQYGDTLLYFTDGVNAPKKINASKAERGGYPSEYSKGTDASTTLSEEDRLLFITTAKQPPLDPPTWSFFTDTKRTSNHVFENTFQFAYQYVYEDGEVSAISPYSSVAVSANQLNDGLVSDAAKRNDNGIRVSVKTNIGDVSKIRVLARNSATDPFFIIDEIDNDRTSVVTKNVDFLNDGSYAAVTQDEINKMFDNVPLKADSQAISGNRLMYSGYTEGFDNLTTDGEILPNYKERIPTYSPKLTLRADDNSQTKSIELSLSDLPGSIQKGSTVTIDIVVDPGLVKLDLQGYPMSWTEWQKADGTAPLYSGVKEFVNVDMSSIRKSFQISALNAMTKADLATRIMDYLTHPEDVIFDTVDQFLDHATELNMTYGTRRFAFYTGSGKAGFSNAVYDSDDEIITADIKVLRADLRVNKMYGVAAGSPDYTDLRYVRHRSRTISGLNQDGETFSIDLQFSEGEQYSGKIKVWVNSLLKVSLFPLGWTGVMRSAFVGASASNSSSYYQGGNGSFSFKAGASHSFGVVYYDERNRSGTVQRIEDSYVKWFGERGNKGCTSMVMRLKHDAPSWAKRWAPVYAGNTTVSSFIQYSVIQAFTESNTAAVDNIKTAGQDYDNKIFVSLRSLSGKEDSYKESKGAMIDYSFTEGDTLRIVSFGKDYYPTAVEFNVVGYEYLTGSSVDNPIYDDTDAASKYKTTGYFLILEDNGNSKFGKKAVVANTDDWDNQCIVEIRSSRKVNKGLPFYEIGRSFEVTNGSHGTERTDESVSFDVQAIGTSWGYFSSNKKVYKGDIFSTSGVKIKINNVYPSDDTSYEFKGDCQIITGSPNGTYTLTVENPDSVVELTNGDVYYRLRQLRHGTDITTYNYLTDYIEDYSMSDFFSSKQSSFGRSNLYSPSAMELYRKASITYSEPFNYDSSKLSLSSFNLSLANFSDFDNSYGSIKYIHNSGDSLICLQQNKMSLIPVSRNIIQYASDNSDLVASNNILSTPQYMAGDYGCGDNPESVMIRFGRVYFTDIRAGKVLSFGASGIEPISEKKMDSFFTKNFFDANKFSSAVDLNSGYDPDNDEYIVSINDIYNSSVLATYTGGTNDVVLSTTSSGVVTSNPVFGSDYFSYQTVDQDWDDVFSNYEDAGNGVVYIDRNDIGNVQLDSSFRGVNSGTTTIVATSTQNDFVGQATINNANGQITFTDGEGVTFATSGTVKKFTGFTVAYDAKSANWTTLYSFIPEKMGYIKNLFFTFKDGRMYTHDTNSTYNSFYGTSYASKLSIISNFNPSMVKTYETISIEGSTAWDATFKNTDQQSSTTAALFQERERNHYAHIGRDTLKSTGHIVAIGEVSSVSGDKITLTSRISNIPIPYESDILKVNGSALDDTNLDVDSITGRKELKADATVSGISAGDVLVARSQSSLDGDPMRDYYLQIDLEKTSSTAVELYSVNATYSKSDLHNQQGQ